jgi:hypothetical protein
MNLGGVLESFASAYVVTRRTRGTTARGRPVAGTEESVTLRLVVLPLSAEEVVRLPEEVRTTDARRVYSASPLRVLDEANEADRIAIGDEVFEVTEVADRSGLGGYFRAIAVKRGRV